MEPPNILPIVAVLLIVTVEYGGWALLTVISGGEIPAGSPACGN